MTAVSGATSPRPRRKRDKGRHIFGGTGAAIVAIIAIAVIASACTSAPTVTTSASSAAPPSPVARATSTPAAPTVGSTIALTGNMADEHMAVTVTKVYLHAKPASVGDGPGPGNRLVAVQFRLLDTGSGDYVDVPSYGALVFDASGQSYYPSSNDAANCPSFPPDMLDIAPGRSGLGCIVFQVPQAAVVTQVQFDLDGGMAPEVGQWEVGR